MNPRPKKVFLFIDANLTTAEQGPRSLLREAKSHAATRTHRARPKVPSRSTRSSTNDNSFDASDGASTQIGDLDEQALALRRTNMPSHEEELREPRLTTPDDTSSSSSTTDDIFVSNARSLSTAVGMSIPKHKGNSDPFQASVRPLTPFEFSLVSIARSEAVNNLWASEVAMRRNRESLIGSTWGVLGLIDDAAAAHGGLSHAYALHARNYYDQKHVQEAGEAMARRHYNYCIIFARRLIEGHVQNPSRHNLKRVLDACNWLASIETCLGNRRAAEMHLLALKRIFEQLGGIKTLAQTEMEVYVQFLIISAGFDHKRPVIHPDEWDPGTWSKFRLGFGFSDSQVATNVPLSTLTAAQTVENPTKIPAALRELFDETKELLTVEEIKIRNSQIYPDEYGADETSQMFRWSHLRKNAVRARALIYWCELVETSQCTLAVDHTSGVIPTPFIIGTSTFEMCLCLTLRLIDRCIFEEQYLPGGLFRQCWALHALLMSCLIRLDPIINDIAILDDERRFDLLWIYSVGAYTEVTFLQRNETAEKFPRIDLRFFSIRFASLSKKLYFKSFEETAEYLQVRYLYFGRLQESSLLEVMQSR